MWAMYHTFKAASLFSFFYGEQVGEEDWLVGVVFWMGLALAVLIIK